eukprot:s3120_g9.t1
MVVWTQREFSGTCQNQLRLAVPGLKASAQSKLGVEPPWETQERAVHLVEIHAAVVPARQTIPATDLLILCEMR